MIAGVCRLRQPPSASRATRPSSAARGPIRSRAFSRSPQSTRRLKDIHCAGNSAVDGAQSIAELELTAATLVFIFFYFLFLRPQCCCITTRRHNTAIPTHNTHKHAHARIQALTETHHISQTTFCHRPCRRFVCFQQKCGTRRKSKTSPTKFALFFLVCRDGAGRPDCLIGPFPPLTRAGAATPIRPTGRPASGSSVPAIHRLKFLRFAHCGIGTPPLRRPPTSPPGPSAPGHCTPRSPPPYPISARAGASST